jgi:hypothetical protein
MMIESLEYLVSFSHYCEGDHLGSKSQEEKTDRKVHHRLVLLLPALNHFADIPTTEEDKDHDERQNEDGVVPGPHPTSV